MCMDRNVINQIVTMYFIAVGIAGFFFYPLPDKWGCRKTLIVFGLTHSIS